MHLNETEKRMLGGKLGKAPELAMNIRMEPLLATGPVVGKHFYGKTFPILNVNEEGLAHLKTGLYAQIESKKSGSSIRISEL